MAKADPGTRVLATLAIAFLCILVARGNGYALAGHGQEPPRGERGTNPDGVTAVDFEFSASSVACERHRVILRSSGTATMFTELCRETRPKTISTVCQVKKGKIYAPEFNKLVQLIGRNGFYAFQNEYSRSITEGVFESTRVIRDGKRYEVVNYADAGPFALWVIQRAIEGVAATADWQKATEQPECPKWQGNTNK